MVWSQRANFVSVPTDCPQRDERLGWTGDARAFAPTASTLFDAEAFWDSWLRDLALDQDDALGVPSVVPDVVLDGEPRFGRAGWADAAAMVRGRCTSRTATPRSSGASSTACVDGSGRSARDARPTASGRRHAVRRLARPRRTPDRPWRKTDPGFLANAYFVWSARLLAAAAGVVGQPAVAAEGFALADEIAGLTWARWRDHARSTQTGCAVALQFRIVPDEERADLGEVLSLVRDGDGRVATGFLGTPLVLPALASVRPLRGLQHAPPAGVAVVAVPGHPGRDNRLGTMGRHPSGRLDPPRPDGRSTGMPPSAVDDIMLSFNHYAYGAVIDWVYRWVAGPRAGRDRVGLPAC